MNDFSSNILDDFNSRDLKEIFQGDYPEILYVVWDRNAERIFIFNISLKVLDNNE